MTPSITVDAPAGFAPSCGPVPEPIDPSSLWVLQHEGNVVLATLADGSRSLVRDPASLGLTPMSVHALGAIDGVAVYGAEVDGALPEGVSAEGLRGVLMSLPPAATAMVSYGTQIQHWDRTTRFCGECGTRTGRHPDASRRAKRCSKCGHDWFPRVSPCTITLVYDDAGRMLMTRQATWPAGRYGLVAGFVEPGESLEECVRREAREETGVELTDIAYGGSQPWPFPHQIMVGFTARHLSGEASPRDGELEDARWFSRDALPILPPRFSIARRLIEAYLSARPAGG